MSATVVATANVNQHLDRRQAAQALDAVLGHDPDLVGLQEWYPNRRGALRAHGAAYTWRSPLLGGCVVGARTDRYALLSARQRLLSPPGRADRGERPLGAEPPRLATVAVLRDHDVDRTVALVCYHLVSGVQSRDRYREDRPLLVARHRRESAALRRLVTELIGRGHEVVAVGDSNLHGFELPGLVSAWHGREGDPGTLGPRRHVDDVFATRRARAVTLVETASDHRAVVARLGPDSQHG